ncbi:MAG: hypothetical protein J6A89_03190 [Clostridia bacterium]|nr:hypothetical protein [Clostridia bacterium]
MGIISFFRGTKNSGKSQNRDMSEQLPTSSNEYIPKYDITFYHQTENECLVVEYKEKEPSAFSLYDTTKLTIHLNECLDKKYPNILRCEVTRHDSKGLIPFYIDNTGKKIPCIENQFQDVWAGINTALMMKNPQYCEAIAAELCRFDRVRDYVNAGLDSGKFIAGKRRPCGNYIGTMSEKPNQYGEYHCIFNEKAGKIAHYSKEMIGRRQAHREQQLPNKNRSNRRDNDQNR